MTPDHNPLVVALDVGSHSDAIRLVRDLRGRVGMFKIGYELFVAEGPALVREVVALGEQVFLDLKLHDIPNTVAHATLRAAELGVSMLTLHAAGGGVMIEAARQALEGRDGRPILVAVTVLTSVDQSILSETGISGSALDQVLRLARIASASGADGVVCSPQEIGPLRETFGPDLKIVTPGVRMPSQATGDQRRVATPRQALDAGADWIVIGRYVNQAQDPEAALARVVASLGDSELGIRPEESETVESQRSRKHRPE